MKKENQEFDITVEMLIKKQQEKEGKVFHGLQKIKREVQKIEKLKRMNKAIVSNSMDSIKTEIERLEAIVKKPVVFTTVPADHYKVELIKVLNFGVLKITENDRPEISITLKGKLFLILHELVKKQVDDAGKNSPVNFKGYVNRKDLEKKLYGNAVGKNRLNSHITNLRKTLMINGVTQSDFIKSLEVFVRINADNAEFSIIEGFKG